MCCFYCLTVWCVYLTTTTTHKKVFVVVYNTNNKEQQYKLYNNDTTRIFLFLFFLYFLLVLFFGFFFLFFFFPLPPRKDIIHPQYSKFIPTFSQLFPKIFYGFSTDFLRFFYETKQFTQIIGSVFGGCIYARKTF